mmetsp:Transcript_30813/g.89553  ORF Transcript_30813/g.89553 Transcript_30813/m.89553 type:complete len:242 (+) Transcript_30813:1172-1897(+)
MTPRNRRSGLPSKTVSSCCARSPHNATWMLRPELSARTISLLTNSFPACDVKEKGGLAPTTTPHKSTVHGSALVWSVCKSDTPSFDKDNDVKFALLPVEAHHCCTRCTSGCRASKTIAPVCSREPLRPPLNSLTPTPLRQTTGFPCRRGSSSLARSPQMATAKLVAVSSATMSSRFTSSLPPCDVNATGGPTFTTTAQMSTLHGKLLDCSARRSTKLNLTVSMRPSSAAGSTNPSRSKTSS